MDLAKVENFMTNFVGGFTVMFFNGVIASAYLLWLNPPLGSLIVVFIGLQALAVRAVRKRIRPLQGRVQASGEMFSAKIVEFISGMRTTRSLGNEEIVAQQLASAIEEMRDSGVRASIVTRWMMGQQMISEYMNVVWCVGGVFFLRGSVTMGE